MKKYLVITVILSLCFVTTAFIYRSRNKVEETISKDITSKPIKPIEITNTPIPVKVKTNNHQDFLEAIGNFESGNSYTKVNRYGYMGRYQFGKSTLKAIDINVSRKTFLNSPELQEEAMERLMVENYKSLSKYIKKYEGTTRYGVPITKSGVLAAAHLGGSGNVSRWFRRGKNFSDANGTKITTYMKIFKGYKLDL